MKSGCESKKASKKRSIPLPVLKNSASPTEDTGKSRTSRWRAAALIALQLLMVAHIIQWRFMGQTISPIEPSEAMYTLQSGAVNAGFIFFTLAILATLVFGRFVCGWGCHIVALQDFCAWLMKKCGLKLRPFRSRLLVFVPLIAGLYMFVWPTVYRVVLSPEPTPLIPNFTNHIVTTDFWQTFPTVAVAIPFLFICGFVTVYFLGSKGFCTYACPYGGFFAVADKFAPGKIRVTDACNQCGLCTANCMSNVQVHAEVKQYGMVIDPGCMKHMDCISVCPNDALYFGFGKPTVAMGRNPSGSAGVSNADFGMRNAELIGNPKSEIRNPHSQLTWPEEIAAAAVFAASLWAVWDVYQLVPMLMALGVAAVTTFLALRTLRMFRAKDVSFHRYALKSSGTIRNAGWAFLSFAVVWIGLNAHSGWVRYHERAGAIAFENIKIPDELALARTNPDQWLSPGDRANIADGKKHFQAAANAGLFVNKEAISKRAWIEYLSGNTEEGVRLLGKAAEHQEGQAKALSFYYRGAILNRLGRYDEALASLDLALAEASNLVTAREEKGESLWQLGRRQEAVSAWNDAIRANPNLPIANYLLAGAAASLGRPEAAAAYEKQADRYTPADPFFHWMVGLRLQNVGMNDLAEKHFQRAIQLNPAFRVSRR